MTKQLKNKKSISIKLDKDVAVMLQIELFKIGITMQEFFSCFSNGFVYNNSTIKKIIQIYANQKHNKQIYKLEKDIEEMSKNPTKIPVIVKEKVNNENYEATEKSTVHVKEPKKDKENVYFKKNVHKINIEKQNDYNEIEYDLNYDELYNLLEERSPLNNKENDD